MGIKPSPIGCSFADPIGKAWVLFPHNKVCVCVVTMSGVLRLFVTYVWWGEEKWQGL